VGSPHGEQFQRTAGWYRQHAHESDKVVGVVRGRPEARQIVYVAVLGRTHAAAESARATMIRRGLQDLNFRTGRSLRDLNYRAKGAERFYLFLFIVHYFFFAESRW